MTSMHCTESRPTGPLRAAARLAALLLALAAFAAGGPALAQLNVDINKGLGAVVVAEAAQAAQQVQGR